MKYYFRADKITYCEGSEDEMPSDAIEVTKRPDFRYDYDFDNSEWFIDEDRWMSDLRNKRNAEITRMDKFMLVDYPIESADLETAKTYRQDLRDCTSATEITDRVLPDCPECCKDETVE